MFKFKNLSRSVLLGTLVVVCICGCGKHTADFISSQTLTEEETEEMDTVIIDSSETEKKDTICIYVCGQVNAPGVYVLEAGSRVCDAFVAAKGLTPEAAKDYWNQARVLRDGEMIYVPSIEEAKDREPESGIGQNTSSNNGKININTATKEELMTLPGIGESRALSIIAYRKEHGGFSSPEEIMEVSGIKEGMYEKMKEYIIVN
jgi:competence protein ComEA